MSSVCRVDIRLKLKREEEQVFLSFGILNGECGAPSESKIESPT